MISSDKSYVSRLLYFYHVAACKNISKAAKEAGLHQSALSRQMIALEKEVGMKLLIRTSDGVKLTRKGEEVFESSKRIYNEVQVTRKKLKESEGIAGKIKICSSFAIVDYILGEPLIEFQKLYPDIEFDIVGNDEVIDIVKSNVDIVIWPYDSKNENITQEPLFELHARLYASPKYIEKYGFPEKQNDLCSHKFIARSRTELLPYSPQSINWFLNLEGCTTEKNCVLSTNVVGTAFQAAEEGIGIISSYDKMKILKESNLVMVTPTLEGPIHKMYFICPRHIEEFPKISMLKEWLKEYFNPR